MAGFSGDQTQFSSHLKAHQGLPPNRPQWLWKALLVNNKTCSYYSPWRNPKGLALVRNPEQRSNIHFLLSHVCLRTWTLSAFGPEHWPETWITWICIPVELLEVLSDHLPKQSSLSLCFPIQCPGREADKDLMPGSSLSAYLKHIWEKISRQQSFQSKYTTELKMWLYRNTFARYMWPWGWVL